MFVIKTRMHFLSIFLAKIGVIFTAATMTMAGFLIQPKNASVSQKATSTVTIEEKKEAEKPQQKIAEEFKSAPKTTLPKPSNQIVQPGRKIQESSDALVDTESAPTKGTTDLNTIPVEYRICSSKPWVEWTDEGGRLHQRKIVCTNYSEPQQGSISDEEMQRLIREGRAKIVSPNSAQNDYLQSALLQKVNEYNQWITQQLAARQKDQEIYEQMRQQAHNNCVARRLNDSDNQIFSLQEKKRTEVEKMTATLTSNGAIELTPSRLALIQQTAEDYDNQIQQFESDKLTVEGFCYLAENTSYAPSSAFSWLNYERERQEREAGWKRIMFDSNSLNNGVTIGRDFSGRITSIMSNNGFGFEFKYW